MTKKIDGLEEAIEYFSQLGEFVDWADLGLKPMPAIIELAKLIQSGEFVVVPREVPIERYGGGGGAANCTLCRAGITHSPYECAGVKLVEITPEMKERARKIQAGEGME